MFVHQLAGRLLYTLGRRCRRMRQIWTNTMSAKTTATGASESQKEIT